MQTFDQPDPVKELIEVWHNSVVEFAQTLEDFINNLPDERANFWGIDLWLFLEHHRDQGMKVSQADYLQLRKVLEGFRDDLVADGVELLQTYTPTAEQTAREQAAMRAFHERTAPPSSPFRGLFAAAAAKAATAGAAIAVPIPVFEDEQPPDWAMAIFTRIASQIMQKFPPGQWAKVASQLAAQVAVPAALQQEFAAWMAAQQQVRFAPSDDQPAAPPPAAADPPPVAAAPPPMPPDGKLAGPLVLRVDVTIFWNAGVGVADVRKQFEEAAKLWKSQANIEVIVDSVRTLTKVDTRKLLLTYKVPEDDAEWGRWDIDKLPRNTPDYNPIRIFYLNHLTKLSGLGVTSEEHGMIHLSGMNATGHTVAHEIGHVLGLEHAGMLGLMAASDVFGYHGTGLSADEIRRARGSRKLAKPSSAFSGD